MYPSELLEAARPLVERWSARLGIGERVSVEVFPAGDPEARCAMRPARAVPEAMGLHDFVLELSADVHADDLERTIVHELVHLLMEPLRERVFFGMTEIAYGLATGRQAELVERWETVIERLAHAFERAYADKVLPVVSTEVLKSVAATLGLGHPSEHH